VGLLGWHKTLYLIALQLRIERNLFNGTEFKYPHIMRRISLLTVTAFVAIAIGFTSASPVKAATKTVYIFNTTLANNKGLGFCSTDSSKGCIDSIFVDGVELTQVTTQMTADYTVAGGVYSFPCRFLETTATSCEAPYMVVYPKGGISATPTGSQVLGEVTINFRRQPGTDPTARVGTVISNGVIQSFSPAAAGVRDVATIVVKPALTQNYGVGASSCSGWSPAIEMCDIGEKATYASANRLVAFLLPGFRNSVVPPDDLLDGCVRNADGSGCIVNVFDPASFGGFMDTDASVFGLASTDRLTGAAQLKIAGPHFKMDEVEITVTPNQCPPNNGMIDCSSQQAIDFNWGSTTTRVVKNTEPILNLSTFRAFIPSGYLMNSFGLTPAQTNASTLPVRRTASSTDSSVVPTTTYTPVAGGIQIVTTGIGFSTPTISLTRILTVKKGSKISTTALLKAAGVFQAKRFGTITIATSAKNGITKSGSYFKFSKKKTVTLSIRYKPSKVSASTRTLKIVVK
jgi:hypothetical protein